MSGTGQEVSLPVMPERGERLRRKGYQPDFEELEPILALELNVLG